MVRPVLAIDVITHQSVNVSAIDTTQLRRIFTMRQQRWSDDTPIVVFVLPSQHDVHIQFATQYLKIFPYKLDRIWNKLTFSGLGVVPRKISSQQEIERLVRITPGAIGYVDKVSEGGHINVVKMSK
ncbi:hypothetical protein [Thalassotalea sp. G2M2-11]|uniref:hypothetical protein n=1 Tax=Thalassotalea sp. G2M2-11 TaxID=2787627 RepID=UPI0019D2BC8C|nr:hypothetical protein [Thalassotalea sp. G2M2-11]